MRLVLAIVSVLTLSVPANAQVQGGPSVPYDGMLSAWLATFVCGDGSLGFLNPGCSWLNAQKATDAVRWQRADWGSNGAPWYYVSDSYVSADGRYIIEPWLDGHQIGSFMPPNDGGQVFITDGTFARIALTEDGSQPKEYFFTGPGCGGTGWTLWDARLGFANRPNQWTATIALLGNTTAQADTTNEFTCPPLSQSYTRWQDVTVNMPFLISGAVQWIPTDTFISEHYGTGDPNSSPQMERFFFGYHIGLMLWEYWAKTPYPGPASDLSRCVGYGIQGEANNGWYEPTIGGVWYLNDCRQYTNVIPAAPGTFSYSQIAFPAPPPVYR
jgi:hypothetical protein